MQGNSNYDLMIKKLDQFIRKYYINKIIRGTLYAVGLIMVLFLIFSVLEHNFYFNQSVRKIFFGSFLVTFFGAIGYWIILPTLNFFRLGKTINHEQAANIIGEHFTDVKDKLLNILQLKRQSEGQGDLSLLTASIEQKTEQITPVPFKSAIDLSNNRQYLKYALPPFLIFLVLLFAAPSIIKDSTTRIINNGKDFEREAPFQFDIEETDLTVVQYDDYALKVKVDGEVLPQEVFVKQGDFSYRLDKVAQDEFVYTFRNVQKDVPFEIYSGSVNSKSYLLDVLEKPNLIDFQLSLNYPNYTGRKDEVINNIGDVVVPQGTKINWSFETSFTDRLSLLFKPNKTAVEANRSGENDYSFSKTAVKDQIYKLYIANDRIPSPDSITYSLSVIPDKAPEISVEQFIDSLNTKVYYFIGNASDDYGLTKLTFNYQRTSEKGNQSELVKIPMAINKSREEQYSYTFDIEELALEPGENVSYYFEVFDNDGYHGAKSTKTSMQSFRKPTVDEFEEKEQANEEEIKDKLLKAKEKAKEIQDKFKKMREKLLQEKELDWEQKKDLEKLLEEQKELQKQLEEAKKKFEENKENKKEFKKENEELMKKEEKLQEMFEEVMDEETKDLMEKIEELMQELNKENALEKMEEMEMSDENLEKELDRLLELYKQLEMEKEITEQIEKLEELAEKQEKLSEETKNEEKPNEELKKEQEELNKEFDKLQEKQEELEKKNEELSPPKDMGEDAEEKMEEISDEMEESQESLEEQDSEKASKSQKSAAEKMKSMAGSLQESMEGGDMEQVEEDMKALRQLLENLISLSFDQEVLVDEVGDIASSRNRSKITSPRYAELVQEQFRLKDDFKLIADSLHALSLRQDKIETFVTEKVTEVNSNMKESLKLLEDRVVGNANKSQRVIMKNVNDLALMMDEAMQQMQQQMSGMMPGNQQCNKPGGEKSGKSGNKPMDKISKGQEGLKKDLQKMSDGMKSGEGGMAKEFAQAAARQAALRKALEDIRKSKQEQGKGGNELQEIIDQMDNVETELVNKRFDAELMKRQQDILTKLLKAENADRQQEYDNKRKAEVGKDAKRELPDSLQEYLKKREAELDLYKTISPELRPYYRSLVDKYYNSLKKQ